MDSDTIESAPEPSFAQLGISPEVLQSLSEMEYETPTSVQSAVWESCAAGRDVVVQSRTGTGKTAAFGLPLVDKIVRRSQNKIQALVLCPTRELANQVCRELGKLSRYNGVTTTAVYGGAPMPRQIDALSRGPHIVCGTPGRVLDHLRRGNLNAKTIRTLVLDESDEMLSMGFERELTAIIEHLPKERQTLLFSATLPPDIERLVRNRLDNPEFITLSGDHIGALEVTHYVYHVSADKAGSLVKIIEAHDPEGAVVFCNTKGQTETVANILTRHGYAAGWLNGDLAQSEREKVMKATRESRIRFLVATDVAARGIDISHLTHVINFDFPMDAEGYVHRTGRTGRAGRTGTAISLVTPQDIGALYILRLTYKIRPNELPMPSTGDERTRLETDLIGALLRDGAGEDGDRTLAARILAHDRAQELVAALVQTHRGKRPTAGADAQAARRARPGPKADSHPDTQRAPRGEQRRKRAASEPPAGERAERGRAREDRASGDGDRGDSRGDSRGRSRASARTGTRGGERTASKEAETAEGESVQAASAAAAKPAPAASTAAASTTATVATATAATATAADARAAGSDGPRERTRRRRRTSESGFDEAPKRGEAPTAADAASSEGTPPRRTRAKRRTSATTEPRDRGDADAAAEPKASATKSRPAAAQTAASPTAAPSGRGAAKSAPAAAPSGRGAAKSAPAAAASARGGASDVPNDDVTELHVDVGRKGGARVRELKEILEGIPSEAIRRVRIRERYTFVEVLNEHASAALEKLQGAELGEHTITASVSARSRD